jgi:hypothetical protein
LQRSAKKNISRQAAPTPTAVSSPVEPNEKGPHEWKRRKRNNSSENEAHEKESRKLLSILSVRHTIKLQGISLPFCEQRWTQRRRKQKKAKFPRKSSALQWQAGYRQ